MIGRMCKKYAQKGYSCKNGGERAMEKAKDRVPHRGEGRWSFWVLLRDVKMPYVLDSRDPGSLNTQFRFMKGRGTADVILILRQMQNNLEGNEKC